MTRLEVWFPEQDKARALAALHALNLPSIGGALLHLSEKMTYPASGPIIATDLKPGEPNLVGSSTGYDIFDHPGWTPEKFAEFVTSHEHLHVLVDRQPCPTLAVLAGYLQARILVDETYSTCRRMLSLITTDGNVAALALEDGHDNTVEQVRDAFFADGLDAALALPGWRVAKSGPPAPFSTRDAALHRRMDLVLWHADYECGRVKVPEGAELSPLNLKIFKHDDVGGHRPVIGYARSSKHLYEIIAPKLDELGPLEVMCAVDGELQRFSDPVGGVGGGLGAHVSDWADWILWHSIPEGHGGQAAGDGEPWEGESTDARLYRIAHNIVGYDEQDRDTTYFSTAADVQAWLRRSLGHHGAPLSVHVLDDIAFALADNSPALIQKHLYDRSDGPEVRAGYRADAFRPWAGSQNWWDPDRLAHVRNPSLRTVMDGAVLEAFEATNCLDYADLEPYLRPAGARADGNSWFVVRLGDNPTCIAFPAQRTILAVSTDNDGAVAEITAHEYFRRIGQKGRKRDFEKRWARWLDENQPLTKEEIHVGLEIIDQIIEGSDDDPGDE